MNRAIVPLLPVLILACAAATTAHGCGSSSNSVDDRAREILAQMTQLEKVTMMAGTEPISSGEDSLWHVPGVERLGVPPFQMSDGPRGVTIPGATTFPVGMARGATWDPALEQRIGEAMGRELRALGGNVLLAPTINILRHPSWGRSQETYGEDTHHLGRMGTAFVQGVQEHVIANPKHYAANSIEDTRFELDVTVDERTLREIYLRHFRDAVQRGGAASIMTAYNSVNGAFSSENTPLLREILKTEWSFDGFVLSDWIFGTHDTVAAITAGLDLEMPSADIYGEALLAALADGRVQETLIDDAVVRMLRKKIEFRLDEPGEATAADVASDAHLAIAREAATKGAVLLKNDGNALPINVGGIDSVAIVGALAAVANTGDAGSSSTSPDFVVTLLQGLTDALPDTVTVHHVDSNTLDEDAQSAVTGADVAIVVVGLDATDEGEGFIAAGDRTSLALRAEHAALISETGSLNARTIVLLMGGGAIIMDDWLGDIEALLMVWYPGQMGGHAVADLVYGVANPSGKLPISFPTSLEQLPPFDNVSLSVTYDFFHGYRHLDREGTDPLFPFGFGLSYTTFEYGALALDRSNARPGEVVTAQVQVTNTGSRAGAEVVQLYVGYEDSAVERAERDLKSFLRVDLEPGETQTIDVPLEVDELAYYDEEAGEWKVEALSYTVHVGSSSRNLPLEATLTVQ